MSTQAPTEDHADQVMARLMAEQSLTRGALGAFCCGVLGVALAYGVAFTDIHARVSIATAFIGALVAFGMRQWGRGINRSFRIVALFLTGLLMFVAVILAGCIHRAKTSRFTLSEILNPRDDGFMSLGFAWGLFREALSVENCILLLIGLAISWFMSLRRLSLEDLTV